jgi:hypothetical protein
VLWPRKASTLWLLAAALVTYPKCASKTDYLGMHCYLASLTSHHEDGTTDWLVFSRLGAGRPENLSLRMPSDLRQPPHTKRANNGCLLEATVCCG